MKRNPSDIGDVRRDQGEHAGGEQIKPKVLIPMHYKTEKCGLPIAPLDDFLKGKANIKRPKTNEVTFDQASLPSNTEIVVLEHAL